MTTLKSDLDTTDYTGGEKFIDYLEFIEPFLVYLEPDLWTARDYW